MTTSIAEQTEAELGGTRSILVRQKRDHIELDRLLHAIDAASGSDREARLNDLCRLVFPHAFAEESVLWPVVRATVSDGEALTLQVEREHQEINELFTDLEKLNADSPAHHALFERITRVLRQDVRDEEDEMLPKLQASLTPAQLTRVGMQWEVVRRTAPTRPHPVVARRPPGNVLAALPLTIIDRGRDQIDRAARRSDGKLNARLRSASGVLAAVAGRVEHLPGFKRGERPDTHSDE